MWKLLICSYAFIKFMEWVIPHIPTPKQEGPYLEPIGGGQNIEFKTQKKFECTLFDPEDCETA